MPFFALLVLFASFILVTMVVWIDGDQYQPNSQKNGLLAYNGDAKYPDFPFNKAEANALSAVGDRMFTIHL